MYVNYKLQKLNLMLAKALRNKKIYLQFPLSDFGINIVDYISHNMLNQIQYFNMWNIM